MTNRSLSAIAGNLIYDLTITVSSNGATTLAVLAVAKGVRGKFVVCLALCLTILRTYQGMYTHDK
jgi:hypothetical protein